MPPFHLQSRTVNSFLFHFFLYKKKKKWNRRQLLLPQQPRVGWWDDEKCFWSEEGITEISLDPPSTENLFERMLQFMTTHYGYLAVLHVSYTKTSSVNFFVASFLNPNWRLSKSLNCNPFFRIEQKICHSKLGILNLPGNLRLCLVLHAQGCDYVLFCINKHDLQREILMCESHCVSHVYTRVNVYSDYTVVTFLSCSYKWCLAVWYRFPVEIEIGEGVATLKRPDLPELAHVRDVPMEVGVLLRVSQTLLLIVLAHHISFCLCLQVLRLTGLNLIPNDQDANQCFLEGAEDPIQIKSLELEKRVEFAVASGLLYLKFKKNFFLGGGHLYASFSSILLFFHTIVLFQRVIVRSLAFTFFWSPLFIYRYCSCICNF